MGLALWVTCGLLAFILARIVPSGRRRPWLGELVISLFSAATFGVLATWLDFGGWRELDWRAGLFVFFGAFAAAGVFRVVTFSRRRTLQ